VGIHPSPGSEPERRAWLISKSGSRAGTRQPVSDRITSVGRAADNTVIIGGSDAFVVSLHHAEIEKDGAGYVLRDLGSTNGTFVNGVAVTGSVPLAASSVIRFGSHGPEFAFILEETPQLDKTIVVPREAPSLFEPPAKRRPTTTYGGMLSGAVEQARLARARGLTNQTMWIMRDTLKQALKRSRKRSRRVIAVLAVSLLVLGGFTGWKIWDFHRQRGAIDARIRSIEADLEKANGENAEIDNLVAQLDNYEGEAEQLQRNPLYRLLGRKEDFVTREIRDLLAEFGAEVYSVPPQFSERVHFYLNQYQGADRPLIEKALAEGERDLPAMRAILKEERLPPDLAFIPVVESALEPKGSGAAGASGLWQFTPATARAYGLRVDSSVDERHNLQKATRAGCRYLRELILDFGTGSSVMLALAAYNSGPSKVKQAVMRTVRDPIKQRNFWYLYRVRALPAETREYVPKVIAVMIIGRNPNWFGFAPGDSVAGR
jgi:pSer/pThr/pTyr-binding forkhead associated (FHA) protein